MEEHRCTIGLVANLDEPTSDKMPSTTHLNDLVSDSALKWIFVGGKGGSGKTTILSSLALRLAETRQSVLIVSIGPNHGISETFGQKFGRRPTKVKETNNLFAVELDLANLMTESVQKMFDVSNDMKKAVIRNAGFYPGIEEVTAYAEMVRLARSSEYSLVLFDAASTGHLLKLFGFPLIVEEILSKANILKAQAAPYLGILQTFRPDLAAMADILEHSSDALQIVRAASKRLTNNAETTFISVCLPDSSSLTATEDCLQQLSSLKIGCRRLIVNQTVVNMSTEDCQACKMRMEYQKKSMKKLRESYKNFAIVEVPWSKNELKGKKELQEFSKYLLTN